MFKKFLIGAATIGAITGTALSAYAFSPAVKDALNNNDYSSFVEAVSELPQGEDVLSNINESNFDQLIEAHQLMENGDKEEARAIMEKLGIKGMFNRGGQGPKGMMNGNPEDMQAVKDALDNNDYQAWVKATSELPHGDNALSVINESNFSRLVEAHNLMEQGRAIMEELGLQKMHKGNFATQSEENISE